MTKGMDLDQAFPERWLHAEDLKGKPWTLTIQNIYSEETFNVRANKKETSIIVAFAETAREYVLNVTNKRVLVKLWGKDTADIVGHKITLRAVPDDSGFNDTGIRIAFVGSPDIDQAVKVKVGGREGTRVIKPTPARTAEHSAPATDTAPESTPAPSEGDDSPDAPAEPETAASDDGDVPGHDAESYRAANAEQAEGTPTDQIEF
jgi:hypothetical protein